MAFAFSGAKHKLALDEDSFQQLLAAAYTLQKHHDDLRAGNPQHDPASIFSEIAALRSQILAHNHRGEVKASNAAEAAALVADCLRCLTNADAASVSLIIDGYLRPTACSGAAAKVPGGSVASNSLVPTERLRNLQAFQSANVASDIRLDQALCLQLQIESLLAFPIERQNEVAGIIELRWSKAGAFGDGDERICQLLADLMSEVLESEAGQIKVPLPAAETAAPRGGTSATVPAGGQEETPTNACRVCGKPLTLDDNFCGNCGMLSTVTDHGLQGKWASMWFMQQAQKVVETGQDGLERHWPLEAAKAQNVSGQSGAPGSLNESSSDVSNKHSEELQETDETTLTSEETRRSPRSVLSVLKSRFRMRAVGQ